MNNRYICKAKRKDNGKWVEGYYVCLNENCHRIYTGYAEKDCGNYYPECFEVIPETIRIVGGGKMTIEQALKIKQNWTAEQTRNDLERLLLTDERPANKVIALACKALEKQIPKKGIMIGDNYSSVLSCPKCRNPIVVVVPMFEKILVLSALFIKSIDVALVC